MNPSGGNPSYLFKPMRRTARLKSALAGRGMMKVMSWFFIVLGVAIIVFREKIVFPGLEILLGIETIVGKDSVVYLEEGGYIFTNPGAMIQWILSVALVGVVTLGGGIALLRKQEKKQHREG